MISPTLLAPFGTRNRKQSLKFPVILEFNEIYISLERTRKYSEEKILQSRQVIKVVSKIKSSTGNTQKSASV